MKIKRVTLCGAVLLGMMLGACGGNSGSEPAPELATLAESETQADDLKPAVQKVTPEEGKQLMEELGRFTLVDVRTAEEYEGEHIEGAILIPVDELADRAEGELGDKGAPVFVYCRSGGRSANAAEILAGLGYTSVYDLGGIIDWPYGTV